MKVLTTLDLNKNQILNAVAHNLAAAPSNPVKGQEYFNTQDNKKYIYDGNSWVDETSQGKTYTFTNGLSDSGDTVKANLSDATPNMDGTASSGVSTNISRADHTHPTDTSRASKLDFDIHVNSKINPHNVTKAQVGLGNVTNDAQVKRSEMGVAGGVATLDSSGLVPTAQLPSFVDDVVESYIVGSTAYASGWLSTTNGGTALTPETGKIYVILTSGEYQNKQYRWSGTQYTLCNPSDVNSVNGKTGVVTLTSEDILGVTQDEFEQIETNSHTHSNKAILDSTTASFTTELKNKVNNCITYYEATNPELTPVNGVCDWELDGTGLSKCSIQVWDNDTYELVLVDVYWETVGLGGIIPHIKIMSDKKIASDKYRVVVFYRDMVL